MPAPQMPEHPEVPHPRRRSTDAQDGFVVSLREHLEGKIEAGQEAIKQEMTFLRAEQAAAALQSSREHAAVQHELGELKAAVATLTSAETREEAGLATRRAIWRAAGAIVIAITAITSAVAALVALVPH